MVYNIAVNPEIQPSAITFCGIAISLSLARNLTCSVPYQHYSCSLDHQGRKGNFQSAANWKQNLDMPWGVAGEAREQRFSQRALALTLESSVLQPLSPHTSACFSVFVYKTPENRYQKKSLKIASHSRDIKKLQVSKLQIKMAKLV